ncbi:MAG: SWIM zinc finger domain-containing protein [Bacteroidetes bacterium]|nr:SWIM zinc finger domain-containing protein [Bacteroidota bacterium]
MHDQRFERGVAIWKAGQVAQNGAVGQYYVKSEHNDRQYLAATPWAACGPKCTCEDFKHRGTTCKHIVAGSLEHASKLVRERIASGESLDSIIDWLIHLGCEGVPAEVDLGFEAFWTATQELAGAR